MHCYLLSCFISKHLLHSGILTPLNLVLYRYIYRITIFQCLNNKTVRFSLMCYSYYYFLGLNRGNEHKSMFYRTLQKHEDYPEEKISNLCDIFNRLLYSCTYPEHQFHMFVYFEPYTNTMWPAFTVLLFVPFPFQSKSYFVTKTTCSDNCYSGNLNA